jgi:hypothetical protein
MRNELELYDFFSLPGLDRIPVQTPQDWDNVHAILTRRIEIIREAVERGVSPPLPRRNASLMANDVPRIDRVLFYSERLAVAGELGDTMFLDDLEAEQMDRVIDREIIRTQFYDSHGPDEPLPELEQWLEDDAREEAEEPWADPWVVGNTFEEVTPLPQERTQVTQDDLEGEDRACGICREDYEVGEMWSELPCEHRFHEECVSAWLTSEFGDGKCPFRCARPERD